MDVYISLLLAAFTSVALACSPEGYRYDMPLSETAKIADIIAFGTVINEYQSSNGDEALIAELEVKCTYKGGQIPRFINISNAGYHFGQCVYKNFTVGMEYIAFLTDTGASYTHLDMDTKPVTSSLAELLTLCVTLSVEYPLNSNQTDSCVQPFPQGCEEPQKPLRPPQPPTKFDPELNVPQDQETSGEMYSLSNETDLTTFTHMEASEKVMETSKPEVTSYAEETTQTISRSKNITANVDVILVTAPAEWDVQPGQESDAVTGTSSQTLVPSLTICICLLVTL